MKLIYSIILFFLSLNIEAQKNHVYSFVVEDMVISDSISGLYFGIEYEYNYERIIYKDSVIREAGIFSTEGANSTELFKIKKGYWYIKNGLSWKLFYSPNEIVSPKVKICGYWYIFKPEGYKILNEINCLIYNVYPLDGYASFDTKYWFNPKYGIIKIETSDITLVRKDIIPCIGLPK